VADGSACTQPAVDPALCLDAAEVATAVACARRLRRVLAA